MIIPVKCFTCGKVLGNKYRYYLKEVQKRKISKSMEDGDEEERERHEKRKEKIGKLMHSLKVCAFRDTLLKECCNRFLYEIN